MNNITNYSHRSFDFKLSNQKSFDFQLADNNDIEETDISNNLILDFGNNSVEWLDKNIEQETIMNYGLTAIDNGAIQYVDDTSFDESLITPVNLEMYSVNGSRRSLDYTITNTDNVTNLKGGFYQGFYKLEGYKYQTLPNRYKKGWTIQTKLRPDSDYDTTNTINSLGNDTNGFFFYLGTRAENKFWNKFENEVEYEGVTEEGFIIPLNPPRVVIKREDNQFLIYGRSSGNSMCGGGRGEDHGFGTKNADTFKSGETLIYKSHIPLDNISEINPFLKYGRSSGGKVCGVEKTNNYGEAIADRDESNYNLAEELDVYKDIIDNAFGLRITSDGRIGYRRILAKDCDEESPEIKYTIKEEYSEPIITDKEWSDITIKWVAERELDCEYDDPRNGELYIYISGVLKHIFKDVIEIVNKPLYEHKNKQVGVPFNISIGGGTQGLLESRTLGGLDPSDDDLPLSKYFAGSFMGDMDGFKLFDTPLNWCEINNN
jgi:hypothetical protein